jgi:hypothetical protein
VMERSKRRILRPRRMGLRQAQIFFLVDWMLQYKVLCVYELVSSRSIAAKKKFYLN